jgi:hypothetical protein
MMEALVRLYVVLWIYWMIAFVLTVYVLAWALGPAVRHVAKKWEEGRQEVAERRQLQLDAMRHGIPTQSGAPVASATAADSPATKAPAPQPSVVLPASGPTRYLVPKE